MCMSSSPLVYPCWLVLPLLCCFRRYSELQTLIYASLHSLQGTLSRPVLFAYKRFNQPGYAFSKVDTRTPLVCRTKGKHLQFGGLSDLSYVQSQPPVYRNPDSLVFPMTRFIVRVNSLSVIRQKSSFMGSENEESREHD